MTVYVVLDMWSSGRSFRQAIIDAALWALLTGLILAAWWGYRLVRGRRV